MKAVTVIGIGDDGCAGLCARAANAVSQAQVLVGGRRHLEFFPQFRGERLTLQGGLAPALDRVAELAREHNVCVLASGDPLFFGVGELVARKVGKEHVQFVPHPSSVQEAFARAGLKWDDAQVISLHGRPREGLAARLRRLRKAAVLTDPENSPPAIARHLLDHGEAALTAWVCESLGGVDERVRRFTLQHLAGCGDVGPLNVLLLVREDPAWRPPPAVSFLHEDSFAKRMPKKGLITKREARMLSLAALLASEGRAYLVEVDPEGVALCRENARAHGADNVQVIEGLAPAALEGLETPDAVFVGGSKGSLQEIIDVALARLSAGGRVVVNAITLDNVGEAYAAFRAHGITPELTLLNVARGEPLARYLRYEAQNPIHIFAVTRTGEPGGTP
ncbi:MAG: bifunctional cobalt-precorrin-7 (C(5))-methyltransferase/cobalt-precorrin-6B (C(15))-methyltransferase [Myxococcales bacterium]